MVVFHPLSPCLPKSAISFNQRPNLPQTVRLGLENPTRQGLYLNVKVLSSCIR